MPGVDTIKSSWADEVELEYGGLPPTTEVTENGYKYVTEYKYNKDDKKTKVVRTYKISKQVVPKTVAKRRTWPKFGESKNDKPGPNSQTTMVSEEIFIQFLNSKESMEEEKANDQLNIVKCRICNGEHWSVRSEVTLEWHSKNNVLLVPRETNRPNYPELRPIEIY